MRTFEIQHTVGFEETNVVGNVYFANHVRWQGRVRELFLQQAVPDLAEELAAGLSFVTLRVGCEYFQELVAFDQVRIRMELAELSPHRMSLRFEYWKVTEQGEELAARGEQDLACMRRSDGELAPEPWPEALREALRA